eukprot:6624908-Prymnesium_polylepis.4
MLTAVVLRRERHRRRKLQQEDHLVEVGLRGEPARGVAHDFGRPRAPWPGLAAHLGSPSRGPWSDGSRCDDEERQRVLRLSARPAKDHLARAGDHVLKLPAHLAQCAVACQRHCNRRASESEHTEHCGKAKQAAGRVQHDYPEEDTGKVERLLVSLEIDKEGLLEGRAVEFGPLR